MSLPHRLSQKEMYKAIKLLASLQEEMMQDLSELDKQKVTAWITSICLFNPSVMLRPDSLIQIGDSIFGSSEITDYVLDLTFRFFTLAGDSDTFAQDLAFNLAEGLSLDGPDINYSLIPQELQQSMPTSLYPKGKQLSFWNRVKEALGIYRPTKIHEILHNNKHLVVVFLLHISNTAIRISEPEPESQ